MVQKKNLAEYWEIRFVKVDNFELEETIKPLEGIEGEYYKAVVEKRTLLVLEEFEHLVEV